MATIGGFMQNFGFLYKFLEPNAAVYTKFGDTKCRIEQNSRFFSETAPK